MESNQPLSCIPENASLEELANWSKIFLRKNGGAYEYWLLGTGFGFLVERNGRTLQLFLRVDGGMGPTQGVNSPQTVHIGTVSVNEWVESIASLSRSLSDLFRRLNPETYRDPMFQRDEASLSLLEKWLSVGRNL